MSDTSQPAAVAFATFVGVDLHKQTVTLRAVNAAAEPVAALTCDTKCVQRIEQWLLALPRPSRLAVEAVGFVERFIDRLRSCVGKMELADATPLANRPGQRRRNGNHHARDG